MNPSFGSENKDRKIAPLIHKKFNSFAELINHVDKDFKPTLRDLKLCSSRREKDDDNDNDNWAGTFSWKECMGLCAKGWPKGLEMIKRLTGEYEKLFQSYFPAQDYASEIVHGLTGEVVDIDRAVKGEPEDMITYQPSSNIVPGTKFQRIIVNSAVSSFISPESCFMWGALIVALVNSLESYGYRCEIVMREGIVEGSGFGGHGGNIILIDTIIKSLDQNSDMDKIAFCVANASYLRRLMFAVMECFPEKIVRDFGFIEGQGYSCPCNYSTDVSFTDLYFPYLTANEKFETMLDWFTKTIEGHFKEGSLTE